MRLALISDVHANLEALTAMFVDMSAQAVDRIVCLGDIVGYNTQPAECIALLRDSSATCVAGNHDLAVCKRGTAKTLNTTAARTVAWTRRRLTAGDLAFLHRLPLKANIDGKVRCMARCIPRSAPKTSSSTVRNAGCSASRR